MWRSAQQCCSAIPFLSGWNADKGLGATLKVSSTSWTKLEWKVVTGSLKKSSDALWCNWKCFREPSSLYVVHAEIGVGASTKHLPMPSKWAIKGNANMLKRAFEAGQDNWHIRTLVKRRFVFLTHKMWLYILLYAFAQPHSALCSCSATLKCFCTCFNRLLLRTFVAFKYLSFSIC